LIQVNAIGAAARRMGIGGVTPRMTIPSHDVLVWLGIAFCLSQSAMFSGLNLALLGMSRLRLEVEAAAHNPAATKILGLRRDFNFLLTTILWGNVAINVILTLLADSVMLGVSAFLFSTVVITFFGEIAPQAYFSRNALRMGELLYPALRFYQLLLYPVARPSAWLLDRWLGEEGIRYFRERDLRTVIQKHIEADESDIDRLEGVGALNFLALDDISLAREGQPLDPHSILTLEFSGDTPVFPAFRPEPDDEFLARIARSRKKWVVFVDRAGTPRLVLNANRFLRAVLFEQARTDPMKFCHRPIVAHDPRTLLGSVMTRLRVQPASAADDVVENDLILLWGDARRVITGTDILGRLLRGIAMRDLSFHGDR
jgi:metal transporter CNNM